MCIRSEESSTLARSGLDLPAVSENDHFEQGPLPWRRHDEAASYSMCSGVLRASSARLVFASLTAPPP